MPQIDPEPTDFIAPNVSVISTENNQLFDIAVIGSTGVTSETNLTSEFDITPNDFANSNNNTITWFRREGPNFKVWKRDLITQQTETFGDICAISGEFPAFVLGSSTKLVAFSEASTSQGTSANIRITETGDDCSLTQLFDTGILSATINEDLWLFISIGIGGEMNELQRLDLESGEILASTPISEFSASITKNGNDILVFFTDRYHVYDATTLALRNVVPFLPSVGILLENGFFDAQFMGDMMLVPLDVPQPNPLSEWPGIIDLTNGSLLSTDNLGFFLTNNLRQTEGYGSVSLENYAVDLANNLIVYGFSNGNDLHGLVYTNFDAEVLKIVNLDRVPSEIFITE
ncbi:MAG: hypothetical protein KTR22_04425 [Flavobacteriaceae bacterium]|nr:hypothetical protein [Flavobacteriaceae bacterium]